MPLTRTMAVSLALGMLVAPMTRAQQANDLVGDPDRGKTVYRSVALCVQCHGWPADGRTGVHLRSQTGSNLRETGLDREGLIEVITCGLPGTAMPYHDRTAYSTGRCHGMTLSDFDAGAEPTRGKNLRDQDIVNVAAYLQAHVIGLGKPTHEECVEFFENPAAKACSNL